MQSEPFYKDVRIIAGLAPEERYHALASLHTAALADYYGAVQRIDASRAMQASSDGRSIKQVVGHILEWDRYTLISFGEILSGVRWPRVMSLEGYVNVEGRQRSFSSVDAFNAYIASQQEAAPWEAIQAEAVLIANAIYQLLVESGLLTPWILDATRTYQWRLPGGLLQELPCGWYLWIITLEHEAVEHAGDLSWEGEGGF